MSFTLGGSAVWVGDESGLEDVSHDGHQGYAESVVSVGVTSTLVGSSTTRKRRSTDGSSNSSHFGGSTLRPPMASTVGSFDGIPRSNWAKDTHFFNTTVAYRDHQLPIKMPLSTFPEEVGDV